MPKPVPKQLRQTSTGRIYNYTKTLADRPDMVPYPPPTRSGLMAPGTDVKLIKIEHGGKEYHVEQGSVGVFNDLIRENEDLKATVAHMHGGKTVPATADKETSFEMPPESQPKEPPADSEDAKASGDEDQKGVDMEELDKNRQQQIIDVIQLLVEAGDKDSFAANGFPKVQAIESLIDGTITAEDRDKAWDKYQKMVKK